MVLILKYYTVNITDRIYMTFDDGCLCVCGINNMYFVGDLENCGHVCFSDLAFTSLSPPKRVSRTWALRNRGALLLVSKPKYLSVKKLTDA